MRKLIHKLKVYRRKLLPLFVGAVVILIPITIFALKNAEPVEAAWWDDNWMYRKRVEITNSGSNQTDFQVSITLDTSTLITNGKLQNDCDDIRLTDINGKILPYWIDNDSSFTCNDTDTKIWVKVPSIPTSGAAIYTYYSNPSAINGEDPKNTFLFFDDFSNTSFTESNWTTAQGGGSPTFTVTGGYYEINNSSNSNEAIALAPSVGTDDYVVEARTQHVGSPGSSMGLITRGSTNGNLYHQELDGTRLGLFRFDSWSYTSLGNNGLDLTISGDTWYTVYFKIVGTSLEAYSYSHNATASNTDATYSTGQPGIQAYNNTARFDDFRVRKAASTMPSTGSPGSEEITPGPIAHWKFDEGVDNTCSGGTNDTCDSTSSANDGANNGATWQTEDMCKSGKCLYFDGSNDYVDTGDFVIMTSGTNDIVTGSAWVKLTGTPSYPGSVQAGIISKEDEFLFGLEPNGDWTIGAYGGNINSASCGTPTQGVWYFITWIYDEGGDTGTIYVNGQQTCSASLTDNSGNSAQNVEIGRADTTTNQSYFPGFIDEVKIYNYTRSADEIKLDYQNSFSVVLGAKDEVFLSEGLVGYWKMDETTANTCDATNDSCDSSGNDNDGAWQADATSAAGKFGDGVTFDGTGDNINISDATSLRPSTAVTLSAWIKTTSTTQTGCVVAKQYGTSSDNNYALYANAGKMSVCVGSDGSCGDDESTDPSNLPSGAWTHYVGVYDGSTTYLYKNGSIEDSDAASLTSISYDTNPVLIGADSNDATPGADVCYWNGELDDVRIYNRSLSPAEVEDLYNWAPGPVGYWPLDENTGTSTIYDKSGNGNNGSLEGSMTEDDWVPGRIGSALEFDGSNDRAVITDITNSVLDVKHVTVSAWVKGDSGQDNADGIVYKGSAYVIQVYNSNDLNPGVTQGVTWCGSGWTPDVNVLDGTWHYITLTYDGIIQKLYIDGVQKGTNTACSGDMAANNNSIYLGNNSGSSYFTGLIDEVKIYNYARTPGQIIEDMNADYPSPSSPIGSSVGWWKFDEGYGDIAYDNSPQGNNGDLIGSCPGAATCPSWTNSGKIDKALNFDGDNDYIDFGSDTSLNPTNFTFSMWVDDDGQDGGFERLLSHGSDSFEVAVSTDGSINVYPGWTDTNYDIPQNTWTHLAFVYDGSTLVMYTNGIERYSGSKTIALSGNTYLARRANVGGEFFDGQVDEFRIYSSALTSDQIKILYNQGASQVMGATSTDSSGNPSWGGDRSYCPPGDTTSSCAPIAEWKFDENTGQSAYDTSSNDNTGSLGSSGGSDTNDPTWSHAGECKTGACLYFDGSDDYVDLGNNLFSESNFSSGYTFSAWIYPTTDNGAESYALNFESALGIGIDWNSNKYEVHHYTSAENLFLESSTTATTDTWRNIVATWDTTNIYLYVDGIRVASDTIGIAPLDSFSRKWAIGRELYSNVREFPGLIDQVKIYDYARTPAQIAWDYNRGKPVGYWKLDECQGTTAYDSSGNGNNGTINAGDTSGSNDSAGTCDSGAADEMWNNGTTGKRNASLDFDGTNDYVNIADPSGNELDFGTGNFTLAYWFKTSSSARQFAVFKGSGGAPRYFSEFPSGATNIGCTLHTTSLENHMTYTGTNNYKDGNWHYLVCTYDRTGAQTAYLYVDGKQILTDDISANAGETVSNNGDLNIGTHSTPGTLHFDGQIDEVKIFNYVLTQQQINNLVNEGAVRFE